MIGDNWHYVDICYVHYKSYINCICFILTIVTLEVHVHD